MPEVTRKPISNEEMKVIVEAEIRSSLGYLGSELTEERGTDAMERYLGEPLGTEMEGRSQVHTRDVLETIEWILPTLVKIFTATDRAVEFVPTGPEDEQQADQEADYLNHVFYKEQNGFLILYTWFKDALLQKNGITKTYVETFEDVTKEEYNGLLDIELEMLLADDETDIEAKTSYNSPHGMMHDVQIVRTRDDARYITEVIAPEEFLISRDAKSVNPTEARFCAHRTALTVSELRDMGYTDDQISTMEMGESDIEFEEERLQRMHLDDEERWYESATLNTGMRKVKINECYLRADKDGDGHAELLKIIYSGDFIDIEEIDYHPINALTPIILTHKFFGLSVADLVHDIQEIRTHLFRAYMDNINQTINGTTYYDINTVNVDDMLTSTPFGIRGVDGRPHDSVLYVPPTGLPPEVYSLNELLDSFLHSRIGDFQTQLDPNVLAQANTGVVMNMLNEAKAKVEMIARIFAEVGVKELFRTLHFLVRTHSDHETRFKLNNSWVPVNPSEWKERVNLTVKVGLGTQNKDAEIANLTMLWQNQLQAVQLGIPAVLPENLFNTMKELTEKMGFVPERHWTHPSRIPPPPQQADPNMMMIQAQMKIEQDKRILELEKAKLENQRKAEELALEQQKIQVQAATAAGKSELDSIKHQIDAAKGQSADQIKQMEFALKARELDLKEGTEAAKLAVQTASEHTRAEMEKYKTDITAALEMLKTDILSDDKNTKLINRLMIEIQDLAQPKGPQKIEYDENGRIIKVGNKEIKRDANGRATELLGS